MGRRPVSGVALKGQKEKNEAEGTHISSVIVGGHPRFLCDHGRAWKFAAQCSPVANWLLRGFLLHLFLRVCPAGLPTYPRSVGRRRQSIQQPVGKALCALRRERSAVLL